MWGARFGFRGIDRETGGYTGGGSELSRASCRPHTGGLDALLGQPCGIAHRLRYLRRTVVERAQQIEAVAEPTARGFIVLHCGPGCRLRTEYLDWLRRP